MKYLRRYLSVFVCVLLLSTVFSLNVSAAPVNVSSVEWYVKHTQTIKNEWGLITSQWQIMRHDLSVGQTLETVTAGNYGIPTGLTKLYCNSVFNFYAGPNGELSLIKKGGDTEVVIYNLFDRVGLDHPNGFYYIPELTLDKVLVLYMDGSAVTIDKSNVAFKDHKDGHFDLKFSVDPSKDIKNIEVHISRVHTITALTQRIQATIYGGSYSKIIDFSIVQVSEESGWLKKIFNKATAIFDSIIELPQKLWNLISDGLKSLFVPDEQFIVDFKGDMENLLSDKLGAVYQVVNILGNSWDSIQANDQSDTIPIPETTIPLPQGNDFSFGGYDVAIVPEGFEWLADMIKTLVGIVCTVLCVNGLRKKYDEVLGGNS